MKKILAAALGAAMGLSMYAATVDAYGVYYANRLDQKALVLGEGPLDNAYDPACVQRIDAYDVNFQPTTVERVDAENHVTIVPGDNLGVTATFFDYGYFAKTTDGKVIPTRDYSDIENLMVPMRRAHQCHETASSTTAWIPVATAVSAMLHNCMRVVIVSFLVFLGCGRGPSRPRPHQIGRAHV